jgi:hypothetical protein
MMTKRNLLRWLVVYILINSLLTACGETGDCKTCSKVSYEDGHEISRTPGVLYCDDALAEKENAPPVTVLGVTTVWECE